MSTRGTEPDPYAVLGVPRTATADEIRAAYRGLGARFHPDRHQGNPLEELAATRMKEINRAYEVLSDARRRAAHDAGAGGARADAPSRAGDGRTAGLGSLRKWVGLVILLPLLFRFGVGAARLIGRAVAGAIGALVHVRGTPVAAAVAVVIAGTLVFALLRRRRIKKG